MFVRIGFLLIAGTLILWWTVNKHTQKTQNLLLQRGTLETTLFLASGEDDITGKINRLGQKRDIEKIKETETSPQNLTFGEETFETRWKTSEETPEKTFERNPFPPLMVVKTKGKTGTLTIEGDLFTQKWEKTVTGGEKTFPIYPTYNWDRESNDRQWENIKLSFAGPGESSLEQNIKIEWSNPCEIFLADNCLPHLAELTDTKANPIIRPNIQKLNPTSEEIIAWIKTTVASLQPYQLTYEEMPEGGFEKRGWQRIRTPREILQEGKGNCLDLSIFWAGMMLSQNLQTWIIIIPEHALIAVGPLNSNPEEAILLETTWLTGKNLQPEEVDRAILTAQEKIQEELKKSPKSVKLIDINYWKQFFKEKP